MARLPNRAYQGSVSGESSSQQKLTVKSQTKDGCNCVTGYNRNTFKLYSNTIKNYLITLITKVRTSPHTLIKPWTGFVPWNSCAFFAADTFGSALSRNKRFCQDFAGGSHAFKDYSTISLPSLYKFLCFRRGRLSDQGQWITGAFFPQKKSPKQHLLLPPPKK